MYFLYFKNNKRRFRMAEKQVPKLNPIFGVKVPNFERVWILWANVERKSACWPIERKGEKDPLMVITPPTGEWKVFVLEPDMELLYPDQLEQPEEFYFICEKDLYIATDNKYIAIITTEKNKNLINKFGVEPTNKIESMLIYVGKVKDIKNFDEKLQEMKEYTNAIKKKSQQLRDLL
jgi:hypothetical protein